VQDQVGRGAFDSKESGDGFFEYFYLNTELGGDSLKRWFLFRSNEELVGGESVSSKEDSKGVEVPTKMFPAFRNLTGSSFGDNTKV
jgi:hypothetical protein